MLISISFPLSPRLSGQDLRPYLGDYILGQNSLWQFFPIYIVGPIASALIAAFLYDYLSWEWGYIFIFWRNTSQRVTWDLLPVYHAGLKGCYWTSGEQGNGPEMTCDSFGMGLSFYQAVVSMKQARSSLHATFYLLFRISNSVLHFHPSCVSIPVIRVYIESILSDGYRTLM